MTKSEGNIVRSEMRTHGTNPTESQQPRLALLTLTLPLPLHCSSGVAQVAGRVKLNECVDRVDVRGMCSWEAAWVGVPGFWHPGDTSLDGLLGRTVACCAA